MNTFISKFPDTIEEIVIPNSDTSKSHYTTASAFGEISVTVSLEQIQLWLEAKEDEHLECKEAKQNFHLRPW